MFLSKYPFGPFETNAILVACLVTKKAAVIDPSFGSTNAILQKSEEMDLQIEKIFLTHSHWDHIADVHELVRETSARVHVHALDAANLENPGSDGVPLLFPITGVTADQYICHGDDLFVGQLSFRVIHTPGHSPGSVCYYSSDKHVLISGDTLFAGSIGNIRLPTSEPDRMWESLALLTSLPPDTRVVPGHGRDTVLMNESWLGRAKEIFSGRVI